MEQLATITRHSDYLNLFRIVSVRETLQHFDCLVTPARYKAQTCYHQDSDGLSPLCNTRSGAPCFPDEGPWAQLGSPLTNSALKGIGLISQQPVRPARWQDQSRENCKTKRLPIEIFLNIIVKRDVVVNCCMYSTENWIYWIFLCQFLYRGVH